MHELSIAVSLIEVAEEEATRLGARVEAIHLRLGALSGVVRAALETSFEIAREGTPLNDSRLVIEEVPVKVWCSECRAARLLESVQWFGCPECGKPTPEVIGGRELEVVGLEVTQ